MNNEDRPTDQRPTSLDVNHHNFGCIQDRFVIFGSKVWFLGTANWLGSFKFTSDRPTLVAMATKFETKLAITHLVVAWNGLLCADMPLGLNSTTSICCGLVGQQVVRQSVQHLDMSGCCRVVVVLRFDLVSYNLLWICRTACSTACRTRFHFTSL